jgi:hypothetical protein
MGVFLVIPVYSPKVQGRLLSETRHTERPFGVKWIETLPLQRVLRNTKKEGTVNSL